MRCDWCEQELAEDEYPRPIRLSTGQPPWNLRSGRGLASDLARAGMTFAAAIRAATAEVEITLWFHRACWEQLLGILRDRVRQ